MKLGLGISLGGWPFKRTLAITNHANTTVGGAGLFTVKKTGGVAATYDASAVSTTLSGDFVLRLKSITSVGNWAAGMNSDPLTDDNFTSIDFAWLFDAGTASWGVYESGGAIAAGLSGAYAWIWRTGTSLGYGLGLTLAAAQASPTRTTVSSAALAFDSSMTTVNDQFEAMLTY